MSSARREEMKKDIIPDMVVDPSSGKRYLKGRFLGKVIQTGMYNKNENSSISNISVEGNNFVIICF